MAEKAKKGKGGLRGGLANMSLEQRLENRIKMFEANLEKAKLKHHKTGGWIDAIKRTKKQLAELRKL